MFDDLIRNNQIIECPKCHLLAVVDQITSFPSGAFEGNARCRNCVGGVELDTFFGAEQGIPNPYPLDFVFRCANLEVTTTGGGATWSYKIPDPGPESVPEPEVNEMNKVWVARHKEAKNLILGIFTDKVTASAEYDHLKQIELVDFDCKHPSPLGQSFPVWVVSVGKDKAYRIVNIFSDEKQAAKIASSIGGRVQATEAIPKRRQRRSIHVYKSWVVLGSAPERWTVVDEINVACKLFPGEEASAFPLATFRRVYDRSLPHRIEILALTNDEARYAAKDLAELTDKELCAMLEYNVDYKLIQTDGKWGVDPCLLNQPV